MIPVMAGHAGLRLGIDSVMEDTAKIEASDGVAVTTIQARYRMVLVFTHRTGVIVTGIASVTHHIGAAVVDKRILKRLCGVTETAVCIGYGMALMFSSGRNTVVARDTRPINAGVIKAAVRPQFQKTGGIVTVVTFGVRRSMKVGFTDGHYAVVTLAAITENFQVIHKRKNGESEGGMAGLTHITGSEVIA